MLPQEYIRLTVPADTTKNKPFFAAIPKYPKLIMSPTASVLVKRITPPVLVPSYTVTAPPVMVETIP
jgi:hypothetical protein